MLAESTVFSKSLFESELSGERAKNVLLLSSVDSTNTYLKNLCKTRAQSAGLCVIAEKQTSGRGRLGKSFLSKGGVGIYLSYLFNVENVRPEKIPTLTAWCAVALKEAIESVCPAKCQIKWVNDLVFYGLKVAGILTETVIEPGKSAPKYAVVGIGINVNNSKSDIPDELKDKAVSLKIICENEVCREKLAAQLIKKLDALAADFPENKGYYLSQYRKNCAVLGRKVTLKSQSGEAFGTAVGIDDDFGLVLKKDGGELCTVTFGDVSVEGFYGH